MLRLSQSYRWPDLQNRLLYRRPVTAEMRHRGLRQSGLIQKRSDNPAVSNHYYYINIEGATREQNLHSSTRHFLISLSTRWARDQALFPPL